MRRLLAAIVFLSASAPVRLSALWAQCPDGTPPPCNRPVRLAAAAPAPPNSVAVLYFDNTSADTADAYLADGITEELIVRLGQVESLQVKPRGTVQRYRGQRTDPVSVGRTLGVAYVVTGSVRKSGSRVSVIAELARANGGVRVWGDVFDRTSSDLIAIESDIAQAVAKAIAGRLRPGTEAAFERQPKSASAAYEPYLRGNVLLVRRGADVARAIHQYEAAVRADPRFAPAWGRLAVAYTLTNSWGYDSAEVSRDSLMARAARAASRALALDSSNADAWLAAGSVLYESNEMDRGLFAMRRAVLLDSTNAEAEHTLGLSLYRQADLAAAERHLRRAIAMDPERAVTYFWLGRVLYEQRRFAAAAAFADTLAEHELKVRGADVNAALRARLRARVGDRRAHTDMGLVQAQRGAISGLYVEACAAEVDAMLGDSAAARTRLSRAIPADWNPLDDDEEAGQVVLAHVSAGQLEQGLAILERRAAGNRSSTWRVLRDPAFDPFRLNPRIQRLMELVWPR